MIRRASHLSHDKYSNVANDKPWFIVLPSTYRDGRWLGTKEIKNPNNAIGLSGQSTIKEHKYGTVL